MKVYNSEALISRLSIILGEWRNGIRDSLKNYWSQGLGGSSPPSPTLLNKNLMRFFIVILISLLFVFQPAATHAQEINGLIVSPSSAVSPTPQDKEEKNDKKKNGKSVTEPGAEKEKKEALNLLNQRVSGKVTATNFIPYAVHYAVSANVPANTIILILLIPLLATIVVAFRYLIGLSGLGVMVPTALSVTLLATGVTPGFILLAAILFSSFLSRFLLKRIRIMQMPKLALSMLVAAIVIVATLTASATYGIFTVSNLSIFPILLFLLLSDRIVALFMESNLQETIQITAITLLLGILGFLLLSWEAFRSLILLYPELILLLIPINILIGRYFGLRVTEYIKFQPVLKHGNK
jgi:hypothetical protein